MSLISREILRDRISSGRCLYLGRMLSPGEYCVSCESVPAIYGKSRWSLKYSEQLSEIVRLLVRNKSLLDSVFLENSRSKEDLHRFFGLLLAQGETVPEYCLHAFIYIFWDSVVFSNAAFQPSGELFFTSEKLDKYVERENKYREVITEIKNVANVDLVSIDLERQHIFLIEVKRASLDDRGVGQILRYFNSVSKLLEGRVLRDFNLNHVRPVMLVKDIPVAQWEALPLHFREIVDFYTYEVSNSVDSSIALSNSRRRLLSRKLAGI